VVVEALRMNERRGLAETAADAYRQTYPALPAPGQTAPAAPSDVRDADPYAVLWLRRGAPRSVAEAAYRALAKTAHPDAGGDRGQWNRIQDAIEAIRLIDA
jgi:DnaJ-class molecular chaperone